MVYIILSSILEAEDKFKHFLELDMNDSSQGWSHISEFDQTLSLDVSIREKVVFYTSLNI